MTDKTRILMNVAKDRKDIIKAFVELRGEPVKMNGWWENASLGELIDAYDYEALEAEK